MKKVLSLLLMSAMLCMALFSLVSAAEKDAKKIFIVHSYSMENICGDPQHQGVVESLEANGFIEGKNLEIHAYAMDTKKVNNTPELIDIQADIVIGKVKALKPDVLVLLDDNAFRTVGLKFVDSDVKIVFSGMNGQPEDYNALSKWMDSRARPGHNITGVYEKLHFSDAFRVQKMILPGLHKAVIISDESPTGKAVLKQVRKEIANAERLGIEFEIRVASSWEDYDKIIEKACSDPEIGTIYPAATLLKDKVGISHSTREIISWTVKHCRTPGIPLNYSFARLGMLGGAGVDFIAMGRQAGIMAARVLKGSSPGDIAVEDAKRYALVFNLKRAEELGITIPNDVLMAADVIYK